MIEVHSKSIKKWSLILKEEPPSATEISTRFASSKAPFPISRTVAGMQIDGIDEQHANACRSMRESLAPDSNVTLESDTHLWKQPWQSTSSDDGMQIDESDEQAKNADLSIRKSLEPDSNVTLKSA
jgi:hypothetical protein